MPPQWREAAAGFEIFGVVLVEVGFAFEGYGEICAIAIAAESCKMPQPFRNIYDIERHVEQFPHLSGVDGLMAQQLVGDVRSGLDEEYAEEIDGTVALAKWKQPVADYLHGYCQRAEWMIMSVQAVPISSMSKIRVEPPGMPGWLKRPYACSAGI